MSLKLANKSQKEWLEKGGVEDALSVVGDMVTQMSQKAAEEGISFKEVNESELQAEDDEIVEEEIENSETEEKSETEVEDVSVDNATEEVETEEVVEEINLTEVISQAAVEAVKQYHESVVAPLVAELKALKETVTKQKTQKFNVFTASDLLPPAAVASAIKKEFGIADDTEVKGENDSDEEDIVTEVELEAKPNELGLLADF